MQVKDGEDSISDHYGTRNCQIIFSFFACLQGFKLINYLLVAINKLYFKSCQLYLTLQVILTFMYKATMYVENGCYFIML